MKNTELIYGQMHREIKKGVVLAVVIGLTLVMSTLALTALYLGTEQSRSIEKKTRRTIAFYSGMAGSIYALEELRNGTNPNGQSLNINGLSVTIDYANDHSGPGGTDPVNSVVNY